MEEHRSWKNRLDDNTDEEIKDAFRLAKTAQTDRCAISVLPGLRGVAIPTASAILTAIDQSRYTVIDYRALESLGIECAPCTVGLYARYLAFCRAEAARAGMSLRDFDRALWMHSKNSN